MLYSIKIVLPQFFLIIRWARLKSAKRPTLHWANLSGIELGRMNKATALCHSWGINHQNHVRDLGFSKLISYNGLCHKPCRCIFGHQTWQKLSKTANRNIYKPSHTLIKVNKKVNTIMTTISGAWFRIVTSPTGDDLWPFLFEFFVLWDVIRDWLVNIQLLILNSLQRVLHDGLFLLIFVQLIYHK